MASGSASASGSGSSSASEFARNTELLIRQQELEKIKSSTEVNDIRYHLMFTYMNISNSDQTQLMKDVHRIHEYYQKTPPDMINRSVELAIRITIDFMIAVESIRSLQRNGENKKVLVMFLTDQVCKKLGQESFVEQGLHAVTDIISDITKLEWLAVATRGSCCTCVTI
jgi:hypothetical protein